jgi:uncharacterized protein
MIRIGLISDTHGLLRPQAIQFLQGCQHIVHSGDIGGPANGGPAILQQLATLAPLTTVRGNNDYGPWAEQLPETTLLNIGGISLYILHDLAQLDIEPAAAGVRVVVSGHSHKPLVNERQGVLYVNPGSAGPRRFKLPVSVGELLITGDSVSARNVTLEVFNSA